MNHRQRVQLVKDEKKDQEIVKEIPQENTAEIRGQQTEPGIGTREVEFEENTQCQNVSTQDLHETSFAGALLQCLYHLPNFKTPFLHSENRGSINPIASFLAHFFESMDQTSAEFVNESNLHLIQYLFSYYNVILQLKFFSIFLGKIWSSWRLY